MVTKRTPQRQHQERLQQRRRRQRPQQTQQTASQAASANDDTRHAPELAAYPRRRLDERSRQVHDDHRVHGVDDGQPHVAHAAAAVASEGTHVVCAKGLALVPTAVGSSTAVTLRLHHAQQHGHRQHVRTRSTRAQRPGAPPPAARTAWGQTAAGRRPVIEAASRPCQRASPCTPGRQ